MGGGFRKNRGLAKIPGASDQVLPTVDRAAIAPATAPSNSLTASAEAAPRATSGLARAGSAGHAAAACSGGRPAGKAQSPRPALAGGLPHRPPRRTPSPRAAGPPGARQRHVPPRGEGAAALQAAVREAVRLELASFFGPRGEHQARACRPWSSSGASASPRSAPHGTLEATPPPAGPGSPREPDLESVVSDTDHVHDHFKDFIKATSHEASRTSKNSSLARFIHHAGAPEGGGYLQQLVRLMEWADELREPPRAGVLASFVDSSLFERVVQVVILLNCAFMVMAANDDMANYQNPSPMLRYLADAFQLFFTMELLLKLWVHRLYFFWNQDAGFNTIDFFLVASGLVDMVVRSLGSGSLALRTVRILKIGKALRAVRVISKFRNLRAILVCIQGSVDTLMWSVLMLCVVFYMFSLIFVQQVAGLLQDLHEVGHEELSEERQLHVDYLVFCFGNVWQGMLTLAMAALGGEDWGMPYRSLEECGWIAAFFYLMFIAFTHIALINIITGIFVDSAMQNLAPGKEALARELQQEKEAHALELVNLCREVDADTTGMLSREQFADGLKKGRIPMLLQLIGLNRHDVERFFDVLSASSPSGEVEIMCFVHGCMRLAGAATSFDLQMLTVDMKGVLKKQSKDFRDMKRRLQRVEQAMDLALPVFGAAASDPICMDDLLSVGLYSDELDPV